MTAQGKKMQRTMLVIPSRADGEKELKRLQELQS